MRLRSAGVRRGGVAALALTSGLLAWPAAAAPAPIPAPAGCFGTAFEYGQYSIAFRVAADVARCGDPRAVGRLQVLGTLERCGVPEGCVVVATSTLTCPPRGRCVAPTSAHHDLPEAAAYRWTMLLRTTGKTKIEERRTQAVVCANAPHASKCTPVADLSALPA